MPPKSGGGRDLGADSAFEAVVNAAVAVDVIRREDGLAHGADNCRGVAISTATARCWNGDMLTKKSMKAFPDEGS